MKRVAPIAVVILSLGACHDAATHPGLSSELPRFQTVAPITMTLNPSQDTYITEHNGLGGPNSVHGSDPTLFAIFASFGDPAFRSYPLVQFDLSALAGETVVGPANLELFVVGTDFGFQFTRTVAAHNVLIPWNSNSATFNNFGAAPDVQFGTDVGSSFAVQEVAYPLPGDRYVSWSIPQSIVQSWIDNPASNHGVLIFNQELPNRVDLQFESMEGTNVPRLTLSLLPPPPTTPEVLLQELIDCVLALELNMGIETALTATLEAALASWENDRPATVMQIEAFINKVEAMRGNQLTDAEADELISKAQDVIAAIEALS